jgi:hypothetical protein
MDAATLLDAVKHDRLNVIRELLDHGVEAGADAVLMAVTKRNRQCVNMLVTGGAPVDAHMAYVAAYNGDVDILGHLLLGNDGDVAGTMALYAAVKKDDAVLVEKLLDDFDVCPETDMLLLAASDEVLRCLVEHTIATHEMLLTVVMHDNHRVVTELLKDEYLRQYPKEFGPALHAAVTVRNRGIILALLEAGARVTIDVVAAANATHDPETIQLIMQSA